jgi:hypothetical protein
MKNLLLPFLFFILIFPVSAQDSVQPPPKPKPVEVKWSGFILDQLFYDTRRNLEALDGMALFFPLPEIKDSIGNDLNAVPNLSMLSFASRLKCNISGPDVFGAATSGYIELDFTARSVNSASVRFRQAWVKLNWKNTDLLVGRAWHPMGSMDVVPSVMALTIGAPFQPFNRSEQITLTQKVNKINFIFSAIFQNDYINNGPNGRTYTYQTNAIIPNLHFQVKYKSDNAIFGVGLDYKRLRPRTFTKNSKTVETANATVDCPAVVAFGQVKFGKLTVSSKTILANNISESSMTGAFGISSYDTLNGHEEYTSFKHWFIWGNVSYGDKLKLSLFAGYLKNLGAGENLIQPMANQEVVFGFGEKIATMLRIVPTLSYTSGKATLAFEIEHNIADYGSFDYSDKGRLINTKSISGTRLLMSLLYNF